MNKRKEIKLKVIPSLKTSMFVWLNTIYIQSGFLSVASDKCLASAFWHEMGHIYQRKIMVAIVSCSLVIFFQLLLLLPMSLFSLCSMFFLFYIWLCFFCRIGEYKADEYSLKHTSKDGMIEMLIGEGSRMDTRIARLFFFVRLHPNSKKRLKNLGLCYP